MSRKTLFPLVFGLIIFLLIFYRESSIAFVTSFALPAPLVPVDVRTRNQREPSSLKIGAGDVDASASDQIAHADAAAATRPIAHAFLGGKIAAGGPDGGVIVIDAPEGTELSAIGLRPGHDIHGFNCGTSSGTDWKLSFAATIATPEDLEAAYAKAPPASSIVLIVGNGRFEWEISLTRHN